MTDFNVIKQLSELLTTDQPVFSYLIGQKLITKTYQEFNQDLIKATKYLKKQINCDLKSARVILLLKPNYRFYLFLIACLLNNIEIVIIERLELLKNQELVNQLQLKYILTSSKYQLLLKLIKPLRKIKTINLSRCQLQSSSQIENLDSFNPQLDQISLITLTSGTTGRPKIIKRTLGDLLIQFQTINNCLYQRPVNSPVLTLIPTYVIVNFFKGLHSVIASPGIKKRAFQKLLEISQARYLATGINFLLKIKKPLSNLRYVYFGGALLSLKDAFKIKEIVPNAKINYIYGASEAAIIGITTLDQYIENLYQQEYIFKKVDPIIVKIDPINQQDYGELLLDGPGVISETIPHPTGDLGKVVGDKIYLMGRMINYLENADIKYFSYQIEITVLKVFPRLKKVAFIVINQKPFLVIEGSLKQLKKVRNWIGDDICCLRVRAIPRDSRHRYKINDLALKKKLKNKK